MISYNHFSSFQTTFVTNRAGLPTVECEYTDPRSELCESSNGAATLMVNSLIMATLAVATLVALL